jgi:DNA polymerase-1
MHHTTKANIWKKVPLNDPNYQLYSGMDPILAARLLRKLIPLVPSDSQSLIAYEHKLAEICAYMERAGLLLDVDYAEELASKLRYEESRQNEIAQSFGCANLNSTDAVADVLEQNCFPIKGRTPSGKRQVNEAVLIEAAACSDVNASGFAAAIIAGKKAGKWRKTWVQKFIDEADSQQRCHASINPLQARTARMSITGIPAQTLPAGDATIRRCFVADEGLDCLRRLSSARATCFGCPIRRSDYDRGVPGQR